MPVAELTLVSDRVNAVPPGGVIAMLVVASMSTWVNGRGGKQIQQPRDGTERDGGERVETESQHRESRQRVKTERQANINECLTESRERESEQRVGTEVSRILTDGKRHQCSTTTNYH